MTVVERIRSICKERNIPITRLEKELGFANGFLNPKKIKEVQSDRLMSIAEYLNVPVSYLLQDSASKTSKVFQLSADIDSEVSARFYKLNDQGQLMALDYMDFLATRYPAFPEEKEKVIDLGTIRRYLHAPAAGYSAPVFDEDYIEMPRTADMPKGADYCLNVRGDSMEPYIHDGQLVYVQRTTALEDGDVGIWYWQGETYCKQVVEDFTGAVILLSANPAREDANKRIPADQVHELRCLGKVLLPKRLPLPHYD